MLLHLIVVIAMFSFLMRNGTPNALAYELGLVQPNLRSLPVDAG
jgi:hypothetical protein